MVAVPVLLALAAAATFPLWRDQAGLPAPGGGFEVENLRAELSAASQRLAQLEARPAPTVSGSAPAPAPAPADDGRLAALEQALRGLQAQPALPSTLVTDVDSISKQLAELRKTAADSATMLRLVDRLDQVEASLRDLQAKRSSAAALLLAVGQLREAVNGGQAFDAELRAVKVLAGDDAALIRAAESLAERAGTGLAPRAALIARFDALAPRIIRAEILPAEDGWLRSVMDRLLSLVTIRREDGNAAGDNAAAQVARAQAALGRGDLAAAAVQLDGLSAGPAAQAASWLAEARARLAADKALSEMAAQAIALAGARP
jgi:uroporphyrinogen-III synthase